MNKFTYLIAVVSIFWACDSNNSSEKTPKTEDTLTKISENTENQIDSPEKKHISTTLFYEGKLNAQDIQMNLVNGINGYTGSYLYKGKNNLIYLTGEQKNGLLILQESNESDKITGFFEGKITHNIFEGTWFSVDRNKKYPFSVKTNTNFLNFSFDIKNKETEDFIISNINILQNNQVIQSFTIEQNIPNNDIYVEDMNFDNYLDFRLVEIVGANGNANYSVWIYNPKKRIFEKSEMLSELVSIDFDPYNQTVTSSWKDGYAHYGTDTYQFQNNQYLMIQKVDWIIDDEGNDKEQITNFEIVNGKSVEIK